MARLARSVLALATAAVTACGGEPRPRPVEPVPDLPDPDPGAPHLTLSAGELHFTADEAGSPPPQALEVGNSGGGLLVLPVVALTEFWIDVTVTPTASGFTIEVRVDPTGLAPGRHTGALLVHGNADNSPAPVAIVLDLADARPGSVATVEIASGGFLLTGTGDGYRPLARAYDAAGRHVNAAITWRSSAPGAVTFDPRGIAWAGVERGAAIVTAEAGGVTSPPVVAVVAEPAADVVVVGDGDVDGVPGAVDPSAPFGPGWRFELAFHGEVPFPVGTRILTRGTLALAGVVVESRKGECGPSHAILEVVPIEELLPGLTLSLHLPLRALFRSEGGPPEAGCPGDGAAAVDLTGVALPTPELDLQVEYEGGLRELRLAGTVAAEVAAEVSLPAGFDGVIGCSARPIAVELPWPGALQLAFPTRLTLGAGLALSGATAGALQASPGVVLEATVDAGIHVEGGTAVAGGAYALEAAAALNPATAAAPYGLELRPHVRAELSMGPGWSPGARAGLFGLRAGEVAVVDWAPELDQAGAPPRPSAWALAAFADLAPGEDPVATLGVAAQVSGLLVEDGLVVPLWRSATGTLAASPPRIAAGGTVELTVALDPLVAPPGATPAPSVAIYRRTAGGLEPVCAIEAAVADPRTFACSAAFPGAVAGERIELHAFAVDPSGALPTGVAGAATWVEVE